MNRNSSIELLRLILMFMIVMMHCITIGLGLAGLSPLIYESNIIQPDEMGIAFGINSLCICAVDCFVLISGYFKIKTTAPKFISLLFSLAFYTFILTVVPYAVDGNWEAAIKQCLFLSHSRYWFVLYYLFLMMLTPLLNLAYDNMDKRCRRLTTIGLILISCYFGFVWGNSVNHDGFTFIQFITIYCLGREISLSDFNIPRMKALMLYILTCTACAAAGWWCWKNGDNSLAWKTTYYNNPLVILEAVGLFMLFKNLKFQSKAVNRLAKSALGIYLFQCSYITSVYLYGFVRNCYTDCANSRIFIVIAAASAVIVVAGIAFDQIRIAAFRLVDPLISRINKKTREFHDEG